MERRHRLKELIDLGCNSLQFRLRHCNHMVLQALLGVITVQNGKVPLSILSVARFLTYA